AVRIDARRTQALQPDLARRLRAFRNLHRLQAIERQQIHRSSQRRLREVDRDGAVQVILIAFENRMLGDLQHHVQIAHGPAVDSRLSLLRQAHLRSVVDARWNTDLQLALPPQVTFTLALLARPANDLSTAAAGGAAPAHGKARLLINHFAPAPAGGAGGEPVFRFGALAVAPPAL